MSAITARRFIEGGRTLHGGFALRLRLRAMDTPKNPAVQCPVFENNATGRIFTLVEIR